MEVIIHLYANDIEKSVNHYVNSLGVFEVKSQSSNYALLIYRYNKNILISLSTSIKEHQKTEISLQVPNSENLFNILKTKKSGIIENVYKFDNVEQTFLEAPPGNYFYTSDLDGNKIQFFDKFEERASILSFERIIRFSLPKYIDIFDAVSNLKKQPICLCYQYNIDKNGYGNYGFETTKAKQLLATLFKEVVFWNQIKKGKVEDLLHTKSGVYFLSNSDELTANIHLVEEYLAKEKKNTMLSRHNKKQQILENKPVFLDFFTADKIYNTNAINHLISNNFSFYLKKHFSPEAGDTFIFFDEKIVDNVKDEANLLGIDFLEIESINSLKAW